MRAKFLISAAAGVTFATSMAVAQNDADYAAPGADQAGAVDNPAEYGAEQTTTGAAADYQVAGERG